MQDAPHCRNLRPRRLIHCRHLRLANETTFPPFTNETSLFRLRDAVADSVVIRLRDAVFDNVVSDPCQIFVVGDDIAYDILKMIEVSY